MAPHSPAPQPQPASAVQHLGDCTRSQNIPRRLRAAPISVRDSNREAAEREQQAWDSYVDSLTPGEHPRFCKDCAHSAARDAECRAVIIDLDPVLGPRRAKCRDARKSDGACGFAAVLFAHPGDQLPADVADLGNHLGNAI